MCLNAPVLSSSLPTAKRARALAGMVSSVKHSGNDPKSWKSHMTRARAHKKILCILLLKTTSGGLEARCGLDMLSARSSPIPALWV